MTKVSVAERRRKQGYSRQEGMSHIKMVFLKDLPDLGNGEMLLPGKPQEWGGVEKRGSKAGEAGGGL